jgi:glycosyltransferase involved in cell wall biosynthesis
VKIAHVTTIDLSLRVQLSNQLRCLQEAGYEITGISAPGPDARVFEAAGFRHLAVPMSRTFTPFTDLVSLGRLAAVMRRERFSIVHTHTPKTALLGQLAARLAGVPIVVNTIHGYYFHEYMRAGPRQFYIAMEKIAALCSDLILSQSAEDVQTALAEGICPKSKIQFLGNGIDLALFDPNRISAAEAGLFRQQLGIAPEAPVVGFVGRLAARRKGFLDFLAAARDIARQRPEVRFLIVGDVDAGKPDAVEASIAAEYRIADRCTFVGMRPVVELPLFYKTMSVLVLPSLFEGVPRVVMEASAMGTPSVVSNVKGNRETVTHEGNGLIVPWGDVVALTAAISRILDEPHTARQMSETGRRMAAEQFDERVVFEKVKAGYARLLREKGLAIPEPVPAARSSLSTEH